MDQSLRLLRVTFVVCVLFNASSCGGAQEGSTEVIITHNPCVGHKSCGSCIQSGPTCSWCGQERGLSVMTDVPRCDLVENHRKGSCPYHNIHNPEAQLVIVKDIETNNGLMPREVRIRVRPGQAYPVPVRFKQVKDTPREPTNDSSNIGELLQDQHNKTSSTVELADSAPSIVAITYFSKCLGTKYEATKLCSGLNATCEIQWELTVQVAACPPEGQRVIPFRVYPKGTSGDEMLVSLEVICGCDCDEPENTIVNASTCGDVGTYVCGVCICPPGYIGKSCECQADESGSIPEDDCRGPGNTSLVCYGRGHCVCGQCYCFPRKRMDEVVTGQFCECDNFSCDRVWGLSCGGTDHGFCECGSCVCKPGWTGYDCSVSTAQAAI